MPIPSKGTNIITTLRNIKGPFTLTYQLIKAHLMINKVRAISLKNVMTSEAKIYIILSKE